jgi:hypothetical protein
MPKVEQPKIDRFQPVLQLNSASSRSFRPYSSACNPIFSHPAQPSFAETRDPRRDGLQRIILSRRKLLIRPKGISTKAARNNRRSLDFARDDSFEVVHFF